jgi:hypothetical protein
VLLPAGETALTLEKSNAIRMNSNEAAAQIPIQYFNSNEIIKLADNVISGIGAQTIANLTGGYAAFNATRFGRENATNLQQLGHYMALQTASLANSSGLGGTDAARSLAGQMAGTTEWTPEAIKSTARVNRALSGATGFFNEGVNNAVTQNNNNPFAARDFQNKWSQIADVNALRLMDLMKNNDTAGMASLIKEFGGPKEAKEKLNILKLKVSTLNNLIQGGK